MTKTRFPCPVYAGVCPLRSAEKPAGAGKASSARRMAAEHAWCTQHTPTCALHPGLSADGCRIASH